MARWLVLAVALAGCGLLGGEEEAPAPAGPPCGDVDHFGVCEGNVLSFCRDGVLESRDCGEARYEVIGGGGRCALVDAEWGHDCVVPDGGGCASLDAFVGYVAWCEAPDAGCIAQGDRYTCQTYPRCGDPDAPAPGSCHGGVAVQSCHGDAQVVGTDCEAYGLTCSAGRCVGRAEGDPCDDLFACRRGLECTEGRCEPRPEPEPEPPPPPEPCAGVTCFDLNAHCEEVEGQSTCVCDAGFEEGEDGDCVAIGGPCAALECADPHSTCAVVEGEGRCVCAEGFERDEVTLACVEAQ